MSEDTRVIPEDVHDRCRARIAELEAELDKESARWQAAIEALIESKGLEVFDASGNESGDPLDWTMDQIGHALGEEQEKRQEAEGQLATLRAALLTMFQRNGGPIDPADTVNGVAYVMVRRDDFEALAALHDGKPTTGTTMATVGSACHKPKNCVKCGYLGKWLPPQHTPGRWVHADSWAGKHHGFVSDHGDGGVPAVKR